MGAEEKHASVLVKDILGPVSVVDIPIDDQNLFYSVFSLKVFCCNSYIVDKAETHPAVRSSMMAWGANSTEGVLYRICSRRRGFSGWNLPVLCLR